MSMSLNSSDDNELARYLASYIWDNRENYSGYDELYNLIKEFYAQLP